MIYLILILLAYPIIGLLWGIYSLYKQNKHYPNSQPFDYFVCFCGNFFFWPYAVYLALKYRKNNYG